MLAKAKLIEVRWTRSSPQGEKVSGGKEVLVQFNPESLKLNFANQDNSGPRTAPRQTTGSGTSTLAVELLFDTTASGADVRTNTENIAYFVKARGRNNNRSQPGLSFEWGSFIFRGLVRSMEETLDYFSEEGVPLRATIALNVSRPAIEFIEADRDGGAQRSAGAQGPPARGTQPLEPVRAGDNVQSVAARNGNSREWRQVANANNIDDPLRVPPGRRIAANPRR